MVAESVNEKPEFSIESGGSDFDMNRYRSDLELLWESRFVGVFDPSDRNDPEYIELAKNAFFESFKNPRVTLVFDGERLAACGGWQFDGFNRYDGLPVYEIRRRTVLDEYKGMGLSKVIYDQVFEDVSREAQGGNFYLSSVTRMERIAGPLRNKGFQDVPLEEYYGGILGDYPEKMEACRELQRRGGYMALIKKFEARVGESASNEISNESDGLGGRMGDVVGEESQKNDMTLVDFTDSDMDYFHQLEGSDGWIALEMENCKNQRYYVMTGNGGERLGIVGVYDTDNEKNITHIVVDPKYRGRRLVSKFYECLLEKTKLDFLIATISRSNIASVKAHEKAGFKKVSDSAYEDEFDKFKYRYDR